jgi:hypothetical protein
MSDVPALTWVCCLIIGATDHILFHITKKSKPFAKSLYQKFALGIVR